VGQYPFSAVVLAKVRMVLILMGVAGSGKTTIGTLLARELGWRFADADDFHPPENKEKISRGIPLSDADRAPWLAAMRVAILRWKAASENAVLACSALKRRYRDELRVGLVQVVFLKGDYAELLERLRLRHGHFADERILASQLATLEEPGKDDRDQAITVEIGGSPQEIVSAIIAALKRTGSILIPTSVSPAATREPQDELENKTVSKLLWRLLPFLFLLYIVAFLDRINVGFAALGMQKQLGLNDKIFGTAFGFFFLGYFFLQIPSNLVLARVGARRWIAVIMVAWGVISCCTALVSTPREFYLLRFLLGVAEAGFFPGMILYLRNWFPRGARARAVAWFMTANPLAGVIGGPISGALLGLHWLGIAGWQWLFVLEGLPAVILALVVVATLKDDPGQAVWLGAEEKLWLVTTLEQEHEQQSKITGSDAWAAFLSWRIWLLTVVFFGLTTSGYGIVLWLPNFIHSLSAASNLGIGVISVIPYVATAIAMVLVGMHSDKTRERRWHLTGSAFIAASALTAAAYTHSIVPALAAVSIGMMATFSMLGPFWAAATSLMSGTAAAAGIALINSVGNLGGFFGPYIIGVKRSSGGGFRGGMLIIAAFLALAGVLASLVQPSRERSAANRSNPLQ
jgi:ACS family tartrate transporter-like MFS transporter